MCQRSALALARRYSAEDAFFSRELWFGLQGWIFGEGATVPPEHDGVVFPWGSGGTPPPGDSGRWVL